MWFALHVRSYVNKNQNENFNKAIVYLHKTKNSLNHLITSININLNILIVWLFSFGYLDFQWRNRNLSSFINNIFIFVSRLYSLDRYEGKASFKNRTL